MPTGPAKDNLVFMAAILVVAVAVALITALLIRIFIRSKINRKETFSPENAGFSSVSHHLNARYLIYGGPLMYDIYNPRTGNEFVKFETEFDSGHESMLGDVRELGFDCEEPLPNNTSKTVSSDNVIKLQELHST